jgi:hypothetical protein
MGEPREGLGTTADQAAAGWAIARTCRRRGARPGDVSRRY